MSLTPTRPTRPFPAGFLLLSRQHAPPRVSGYFFWAASLQLLKRLDSMTRSIATMVRAIIDRTKLPRTKIEQTTREIQNAGLVQLGRGASARPVDLANTLLALSADKVRHAPAAVIQYSSLRRLVEAEHVKADDALESWVTKIWAGDRDESDKTLRIVQTWREIVFEDRDGYTERFYPADALMELHTLFDVRRSIEVPGRVIAQIGADLGIRGCQYAV